MDRRLFLGGFTASSFLALQGCSPTSAMKFRYASPSLVWWNAVPYFADKLGFYKKYSITVNQFDVATGTKSKKAVVDSNAETGVAAPNSFSLATAEELQGLRIVANTMQSDATVSIVMSREVTDWSREVVATVRGTIAEFYFISYLQKIGQLEAYTEGLINFISTSPTGVANAVNNGEATVGVVWEPVASMMASKIEDKSLIIRDPDLYTQQIYLLSRRDYMQENKEEVTAMQNAFRDSCQYITENRSEAAKILEEASDFTPGFLSESNVWKRTKFEYSVDANAILPILKRDYDIAQIAGLARTSFDDVRKAMEFLQVS